MPPSVAIVPHPAGSHRGSGPPPWRAASVIGAMCAVGLGYYAGAKLGLELRLPGATPSVLWPPNAILTSALLLVPPRYWAWCLAAALPAHLLLQLQVGWPVPLVLALFATNCSEALIAASVLRRLSDAPTRLDSLRRVAAFLVACAFLGPFVSSFLDAAAVTSFVGEPYGAVWRARFFSNVLTELTVVPALVIASTRVPRWFVRAQAWKWLEAAVLMSGLVGVWMTVSFWPGIAHTLMPGTIRSPLAFMVPFVAWAVIRFGSAGTSLTLLPAVVLAVWAAARGLSPSDPSPPHTLVSLQLVLIALSMPLLVLAAAIEERHAALYAVAVRLRFEELLSHLSQAFVHVPSDATRERFDSGMERVGRHFGLEGVLLLERGELPMTVRRYAAWLDAAARSAMNLTPHGDFPWAVSEVLAQREVVLRGLDDLPSAAIRDRESFVRYGFRSGIGLPLVSGDEVVGVLGAFTVSEKMAWTPELVARLHLVAGVFANAMARRQHEDALRASEALKTAILASLSAGVAVLNRSGRIIAVNERWKGLASRSGLDCACQAVGDDLLSACRRDAERDGRAAALYDGIRAVLEGTLPSFDYPHTNGTSNEVTYWVMSARPLEDRSVGALVTHTEITARKRGELEIEAARAELAHLSRVAMMGELAASIAHELNQPLTAIVSNGRAAQRMLAQPAAASELPAILDDIVADGMRAGAVIQRTRSMVRKGGPAPARLDLGNLVREVATLVANDALIRQVNLLLPPPMPPVVVEGDRIQLQQVVLNLLINAFEAMPGDAQQPRDVVVSIEPIDGTRAEVAVRDTGAGIPVDAQSLFDAFYTTKPSGMGMGLSVARSILEAHGGDIRATANPGGGATVRFTLPLAGAGRP